MIEFPGLDEIIKLGKEAPSLDPLIIESIPYKELNYYVDVAINTLRYRLSQAGVTDYEITIISHSDTSLILKDFPYFKEGKIRLINEDNLPSKTVYILTTKIGDMQTIKPLDNISWEEFFIQLMFGKKPKLTISPMWAQARIRYDS